MLKLVALGGAVLTIAGCAQATPTPQGYTAPPTPSRTAKATATPTPTPAAIPTRAWKLDQAALSDWETAPEDLKDVLCNAFFAENPPNAALPAASSENTGEQILARFGGRTNVLFDLHLDTTVRNGDLIASSLVDCVSSVHSSEENSATGSTQLRETLVSPYADELRPQTDTKVIRYSDGLTSFVDSTGVGYNRKTVEYFVGQKAFPGSIAQAIFKWDPTVNDWKLVAEVPDYVEVNYGANPPIYVK